MAKKSSKKPASPRSGNATGNLLALLAIAAIAASGYMGFKVYEARTADQAAITEASDLAGQTEDLSPLISGAVDGGADMLDAARDLRIEIANGFSALNSKTAHFSPNNPEIAQRVRSLANDWTQIEGQVELIESLKPQLSNRFELRGQIIDQISTIEQQVSQSTSRLVEQGGTARQVYVLGDLNRILRDLRQSLVDAGDAEVQRQADLVREFRSSLAALLNGDSQTQRVAVGNVRGQITQIGQLYTELRSQFENLYSASGQIDRARKAAETAQRLSSVVSSDLDMLITSIGQVEDSRPITAQRTLIVGGAGIALLIIFIIASVRSNSEQARDATTSKGMMEEGNRRRQEEMQQLISEMHPLTAGDLTTSASENGAFTKQIAQVFNKAIYSLRTIVNQLQVSSMEIASAAEQSHRTSENLKVVRKRNEQTLSNTSNLAEKMDKIIVRISQHASETAVSSSESSQAVDAGRKSVEKTHRAVEVADTSIRVSADMVKKLGEEIQQIESITMTIREITDNLQSLSYNTQLIADRSVGDEKDAISATADKMENLAKTVFGSLEEIIHLVNGITGRAGETQGHIEKSRGDFVDLVKNSNTTLRAFELIGDATAKSHENVRQIESETQQLTTTSQRFIDNISEIQKLSSDSSAATEETTDAINKLANLSSSLKDAASKFRTGRASGIESS